MSSRSWLTCAASIAETASFSRCTRLLCIAFCNSSSVGMAGFLDGVGNDSTGVAGLLEQSLQRRHLIVPFDQRWNGSEARQRRFIQRPDLVADRGTVVVDTQRAAVGEFSDAVPGEMNLAHRIRRQCGDVGRSIPAMIVGADADIVDVAEDAATSSFRDGGHEFPFRNHGFS